MLCEKNRKLLQTTAVHWLYQHYKIKKTFLFHLHALKLAYINYDQGRDIKKNSM